MTPPPPLEGAMTPGPTPTELSEMSLGQLAMAMHAEYMADECCDQVKVNQMIELLPEAVRRAAIDRSAISALPDLVEALEALTAACEWEQEVMDMPSPPATREMLSRAYKDIKAKTRKARKALSLLSAGGGEGKQRLRSSSADLGGDALVGATEKTEGH